MSDIKHKVFHAIESLLDDKTISVSEDTPLIGSGGALDSLKLVELCLLLEDLAEETGFEFDWTSDSAMSNSRSMFRNAGALALEFISQSEKHI